MVWVLFIVPLTLMLVLLNHVLLHLTPMVVFGLVLIFRRSPLV
jgi:hypothetical protein